MNKIDEFYINALETVQQAGKVKFNKLQSRK